MQFEGIDIALTCNDGDLRERERLKPKRGQFRSLAVNRVERLSAARLHHTIVETATEQIQASTAVFVSYVSE